MNITVTIPVFNEEREIETNVERLDLFLQGTLKYDYEIVIVDNGSTDQTLFNANRLVRNRKTLRLKRLDEQGRGRALKTTWLESAATVVSYMDVDLSTDLTYFPALVEAVIHQGFDIACGSRFINGARTTRTIKRTLISWTYNQLLRTCFRARFSDAQCGFKAMTRAAATVLLPLVEDTGWFFDTELLILGERMGFKILDLPVRWVDDSDSRVKICRTAWEDIKGMIRLGRNLRLLRRYAGYARPP